MRGITKRFPGVLANDDVSFEVAAGEVHALLGENGAGKTTLMNILTGFYRPDDGEIEVAGKVVELHSPRDAITAGIGMVHQHFRLVDTLSVSENVVLGSRTEPFLLNRASRTREVELISEALHMPVDPDAKIWQLSVGEQQRVEIMKAVRSGSKVLILDEPTAVLVPQEVDELFVTLRQFVADGATVIFISHKLDEVLAISDEITVIRNGTTVATVAPADVDRRKLGELMVGSELPDPSGRATTVGTTAVLSVTGLDVSAADGSKLLVDGATFTVHAAEVLGVAGIEGNGQLELCEAILGLRPIANGAIELNGIDLTSLSVQHRREAGISYIPFDRHREGLLLESPLWENTMLGRQEAAGLSKGPFISASGARRDCATVVERFGVRTPGIEVPAFALSGGNQQKLVVGRELSSETHVLLAAHPTRGVDIGAQAAIWDELRAVRDKGVGVLLISADLDELIGLSDRIAVIYDGKITAMLDPATATPALLGSYMTGEMQGAA
jgi:simple sugar transport system ATP-binding protein